MLVTISFGNSFCVCICWAEVAVFPGHMGTRTRLPLLCNTACEWTEVSILGKGEREIDNVFKFNLQVLLTKRWSSIVRGKVHSIDLCKCLNHIPNLPNCLNPLPLCTKSWNIRLLGVSLDMNSYFTVCFWPLRGC